MKRIIGVKRCTECWRIVGYTPEDLALHRLLEHNLA